ncbi:maltotransferase domain-containing protein, partial [Escherichia coli]|uniref:maltotransferase domain-containing protein n=1 Tax=Escherichia coli TaxID=562 RepID=UPI003BA32AA2
QVVNARIFADGHEQIAAVLLWQVEGEELWHRVPFVAKGNDYWEASFTPLRVARHYFAVETWWDGFGTYREELRKKHEAAVPIALEL